MSRYLSVFGVHAKMYVWCCSTTDRSTLLEFANNILNLDIGEQLNPLIAEVERLCGEEVDDAENNYEGEGGRERETEGGRERGREEGGRREGGNVLVDYNI